MTDNEIIKALESCKQADKCAVCPLRHEKTCLEQLSTTTLDLINRQKAELEKLKTQLGKRENFFTVKYDEEKLNDIVKSQIEKFEVDIITVRNEAIREFAEKVKSNCEWFFGYNISRNKLIDGIAKEMMEGENG